MDRLYISPCLIFRWPWRVEGHEREIREREEKGERDRERKKKRKRERGGG